MNTESGDTRHASRSALPIQDLRLLRAIVENARDAILVTEAEPIDAPGPRIVYANESFTRMTGYALEEVVGRTPRILQAPDTDRVELDRIRAALEAWIPVRVELLNRRKNGDSFWVELDIVPVADENGWFTHWVSIQREITERKRAEQEVRESESRLRAALSKNASDIVLIVEADGTLRYGSPSVESVLGVRPGQLVGSSIFGLVHPEDREAVRARFADVVANPGVNKPMEFRVRTSVHTSVRTDVHTSVRDSVRSRDGNSSDASGAWCPLEAVGNNMLEDPGVRGIVVNAWDVTSRKHVEDALYLRDRAIAASSNGIIITDPSREDNPIVYVNPKFEEITGYAAEEALGRNCRFLRNPEEDQPGVDELRIAIEKGREWSGPLRNYRKDGTLFWNELYIAPVRDDEGRVTNFIGVQKDITERKVLEERLAHQAFHDPLTGLPNRTLFVERLGHALMRSGNRQQSVGVLSADLDNFKVINDSLGHEAGDELLVQVAGRLKACLRPEDTVARLGGDEFVVLVEVGEDAGKSEGAEEVARRIARTLRDPLPLNGQDIHVTVSIGIAFGDNARKRPGDLLRNADLAMYRVKSRGKDHYEVFEQSMARGAKRRLQLEGDLRRALDQDELVVRYQPKVSLKSGEMVAVEALVRWERPGHGLVSPAEFIPVAEETGLIMPLGLKVLEKACLKAREWQDIRRIRRKRGHAEAYTNGYESYANGHTSGSTNGYANGYTNGHAVGHAEAYEEYDDVPDDVPFMVSVNLSAMQFRHPHLVEDVERVLRDTGLDPCALTLEITESVAMEDAPRTVEALKKLKNLGVKLAVDDFGTGYSSLSYLRRFPVDYLKIDRSFVGELEGSAEGEGLVAATVGLAHLLGLEAVAEGVETEGQLLHLRNMGCDLAQGFHLYRPRPPEEISALLALQQGTQETEEKQGSAVTSLP